MFSTLVPVRIGDINYGGHVGNDAILSVMHEARMQWLRHIGATELDAYGNAMIMGDVMIAYKGEAFYGDVLEVTLYAVELTTYSFDLLYLITTTRQNSTTTIAHAKTGMVCFDYNTRKVQPLTDAFRAQLTGNSASGQ